MALNLLINHRKRNVVILINMEHLTPTMSMMRILNPQGREKALRVKSIQNNHYNEVHYFTLIILRRLRKLLESKNCLLGVERNPQNIKMLLLADLTLYLGVEMYNN